MGSWNFNYDAVDRLSTAAAGSNAPTAFQNQNAAWSYDSYGNRTAQSFTNGANSSWATYNSANNRISASSTAPGGYAPDASGNTLYDGSNRYWYDAEGQLCAVQNQAVGGLPVTQYVYDAEGARIAKGTLSAAPTSYTATCAPPLGSGFTLTARYLVDLGGDQVTELNTTSGTLAWAHSNVFSAARLTATYDTNGLHYELADPLGTKRIQANISGQIEESCVSLPFGDALNCPTDPALTTSDDATEHHFTGKERDAESGNDYFGARYYASSMGRFMSPDWAAQEEPVPYANLDDPQSLNLYSYVRNNPLVNTDPTGHGTCPPCIDVAGDLEELEAWWASVGAGGCAGGGAAAAGGAGGISLSAVAIGFVGPFLVADHFAPTVGQSDADEIAQRDELDRENQSAQPQTSTSGAGARQGGGPPYDDTPENRARMAQGKPPIGKDGKPVELHSPDQTHTGQSQAMTRTNHRGGTNFAKNHTNTGQKPSVVNRKEAAKQRRAHWKKEHKEKTQQ